LTLVGVFAVFHGIAHGQELAGESRRRDDARGMPPRPSWLHGAGIALGWSLRNSHRWLPRLAGASVAMFGVALLGGLA